MSQETNFRRYIQLIAEIGYVGRPLKDLETELSRERGVSTKTIWYYIISRSGKTGKVFVRKMFCYFKGFIKCIMFIKVFMSLKVISYSSPPSLTIASGSVF